MDPEIYQLRADVDRVEWRAVGRRRMVLDLLRTYARAWPPNRALDVGCGSGVLVEELGEFGRAFGVDPSEHAVRACRARGLARLSRIAGDGGLPFRDKAFDVVTAIDVVEHAADDLGLLVEMRRVLSDRGVAVIIVPAHRALWSTRDVRLHHYRRYAWGQLLGVIGQAGLRVRHVTHLDAFLLAPLWLMCQVAGRTADGVPNLTADTVLPPPWLNALLVAWMGLEGRYARVANLPAGVSIAVVAEREGADGAT